MPGADVELYPFAYLDFRNPAGALGAPPFKRLRGPVGGAAPILLAVNELDGPWCWD